MALPAQRVQRPEDTGNHPVVLVDAPCSRCRKPFKQNATVSCAACQTCMTELAAAFWAEWDKTHPRKG